MKQYADMTLDEERALYGVSDAEIFRCTFDGPADGESALKECRNINVSDCIFHLRYPLWHVTGGVLKGCSMNETCRAALWYDSHLSIENCSLHGIKALRECRHIELFDCDAVSSEFGWFCDDISMMRSRLESEYAFLHTSRLRLENFALKGKYSFQYVENAEIVNSQLDTKDAFWHSKNVTVTDCVVRGEYLGWYSENLTLIRCEISGTQPLCYAKNLRLIDCTMNGCDLAFEKSSVNAVILGRIESIKAPKEGSQIQVDEVGAWLDENETVVDPVARA